jgi:hypothetical protein
MLSIADTGASVQEIPPISLNASANSFEEVFTELGFRIWQDNPDGSVFYHTISDRPVSGLGSGSDSEDVRLYTQCVETNHGGEVDCRTFDFTCTPILSVGEAASVLAPSIRYSVMVNGSKVDKSVIVAGYLDGLWGCKELFEGHSDDEDAEVGGARSLAMRCIDTASEGAPAEEQANQTRQRRPKPSMQRWRSRMAKDKTAQNLFKNAATEVSKLEPGHSGTTFSVAWDPLVEKAVESAAKNAVGEETAGNVE